MIRITGDVSLTDGFFDVGYGLGSLIKEGDNPFLAIIKGDDFWIGNFEGVASDTSCLSGVAAQQFRIDPFLLDEPIRLFDVFGVANNHVMQHGDEAYEKTVDALQSRGKIAFGSSSKKSALFEVGGKQFSITGFSQRIDQFSKSPCYWHNPDFVEIWKEYQTLPRDSFKIVYVHWGNEFINRPSQSQVFMAHLLIDMGFDLVVGMHPHVIQGFEEYKNKYIFYSLGNFSFDMSWEQTKYGAIVNIDCKGGEIQISHDYVFIDKSLHTKLVDEESVPIPFRFSSLNTLLGDEDNGEQYFKLVDMYYHQYRRANRKDIVKKMMHHPQTACYVIKDFIKRRIIK